MSCYSTVSEMLFLCSTGGSAQAQLFYHRLQWRRGRRETTAVEYNTMQHCHWEAKWRCLQRLCFIGVGGFLTHSIGQNRGGSILFVSDSWCRQYTVREPVCSTELLLRSLGPFYLPRGVWEQYNPYVVFFPLSSNAVRAADQIAECSTTAVDRRHTYK